VRAPEARHRAPTVRPSGSWLAFEALPDSSKPVSDWGLQMVDLSDNRSARIEQRRPGSVAAAEESMGHGEWLAEPRSAQEHVAAVAWGQVWSRAGLDRRTRSLLYLGMLTALNRDYELGVHVRSAVANGCSAQEIEETLMQAAAYCGASAALESLRVAERVSSEFAGERAPESVALGGRVRADTQADSAAAGNWIASRCTAI
jgi:4-carboxymuconolactone decarboxylase